MKTLACLAMVAAVFALSVPALAAEKDPSFFSKLNPFAAKEEKNTLPKWVPPQQLPKANAKPTTWNRMSNGWNRFVDFLNPFDDANDKFQNPRFQNPKNISDRKRAAAPPYGSGTGSSNSQQPNSVQDFLSLPRPGNE